MLSTSSKDPLTEEESALPFTEGILLIEDLAVSFTESILEEHLHVPLKDAKEEPSKGRWCGIATKC